MKKIVIFIILSSGILTAWAHDVDQAFFTFIQEGNKVKVEAEFPWTIRRALIAHNPELKYAKDPSEFHRSLVEYIKECLVLEDVNGKNLDYVSLEKLNDVEHTHQTRYLIRFAGGEVYKVKNSLMFNLFQTQINNNYIRSQSEAILFITNRESETFVMEKTQQPHHYLVIILSLVSLIYVIVFIQGKRAF